MDIFSKAELKSADTETLKKKFSESLSGVFSTTHYKVNPQYLYRGRPNWDNKLNNTIDFFNNITELWAPPESSDLKQGRCNNRGQSLFYCTQNATAILFELKCKPGDLFTIGVYKCLNDLKPMSIIGAHRISSIDPAHKTIFGNHYAGLNDIEKRIHDYLDSLFIESDSIFYNATNAITSILLNKNTPVPGFTVPDDSHGLIYSSVATQLNTYNIALEPEYAKTILEPVEFRRYKILECPSPNHFVLEVTHISNKINSDGTIEWVELSPTIIEKITDLPVE